MADNSPARVILWSTPRSVSTTFLKCMTFVKKAVVWHEPYIFANRCAPDGTIKAAIDKVRSGHTTIELPLVAEYHTLADKHMPSISTVGNVYEASNHSFSWMKNQLEAPQLDKDLVFVKDMVQGIDGHYEAIPEGFRHTFLMRHPLKVFDSFKRMYDRAGKQSILTDLPEMIIPCGRFFKELHDLVEYVKINHDLHPVILDADDLLADPKGTLSAYCKATGIRYSDSLLQWPAGTDEIFKRWTIQKEVLCIPRLLEVFKKSFDSTCFGEPLSIPNRSELSEDVLQLADFCMPYYDRMYQQRLK